VIIIAADTSTTKGSVAVTGADGEVHTLQLDPGTPHSQTLLPGIESILAASGLARGKVDIIAVGIGPGAFTGLRVGLATLKGWSAAAGIPMVPVISLDAVALPVLGGGVPVMVVMDARKGELYTAVYPSFDEDGMPVRPGNIELLSTDEAAGKVAQCLTSGEICLAGTGVPYLLEKGLDRSLSVEDGGERVPLASDILAIASVKARLGMTVDATAIIPSYVRPPDAKPPSPGAIITKVETRIPGPGSRDNEI